MNHEVLVIGGGIGGLTVAALLAARGLDVCLFERQSSVGGCVADFEHLGYRFEPTAGLYTGWEAGGVYEKVFAELGTRPPQAELLATPYLVRLPDQTEVAVSTNRDEFETNLSSAFPECAADAIAFYRKLRGPNFGSVDDSLAQCSLRFRRFVEVQAATLAHGAGDQLPIEHVARALTLFERGGFWEINGGAQALADSLANSFRRLGGTLRLNSRVLRLAYDASGQAVGVDLLSGERILASRAIVSNLTLWDTYGKLVGLSRTPPPVSALLRKMRSWGAYLIFLGMEQAATARLAASRLLAVTDWQENGTYHPVNNQIVLAISRDRSRAPDGKIALTVSTLTDVEEWFSFHEDSSFHEQKDQETLERLWPALHKAMPDLGDSVEVIETATPQTYYENTRRRLGMLGSLSTGVLPQEQRFLTTFPNVFLVGDTVTSMSGLDGVTETALKVADAISK